LSSLNKVALILNIETATKVCSVCLAENENVLARRDVLDENYSHAEKLLPFIREVIAESGKNVKDLDAIAVSAGPGSYTGLRIGCSTAKGFCFGLNVPLIAIDSLKSLASMTHSQNELRCVMFDARRNEVYAAVYDENLNELMLAQPIILDEYRFDNFLDQQKVVFSGPGAVKARDQIKHSNARFDTETLISSIGMVKLAAGKFSNGDFADLSSFEPLYLKEFVPGVSQKLI